MEIPNTYKLGEYSLTWPLTTIRFYQSIAIIASVNLLMSVIHYWFKIFLLFCLAKFSRLIRFFMLTSSIYWPNLEDVCRHNLSRFSNVYRIYIKWKGDAEPAVVQFKIRDVSINAEFNYKCDHQITFGVNFWDN